MDGIFNYADIIVLAVIAGFIWLRLRQALGTREGHEQSPERFRPRVIETQQQADNFVQQREQEEEEDRRRIRQEEERLSEDYGPRMADTFKAMRKRDPGFTPSSFLNGARAAFEMIVEAFAKGDKQTLKNLLSPEVYEGFSEEIDRREREGEKVETTLIAIESAEIRDADLTGTRAEVTLRFVSEQINVTRDEKGEVIAGSPSEIEKVVDIWTFDRDVTSSNPNWRVVATDTE